MCPVYYFNIKINLDIYNYLGLFFKYNNDLDSINQSLGNVQSLIPVQNNSYAQYIRFGNIVVVSGYYHKTNSSWDIFNGLPYSRIDKPFIVGKAYSVAGTENILYINEHGTLQARIEYNTELMYFTCAYICE